MLERKKNLLKPQFSLKQHHCSAGGTEVASVVDLYCDGKYQHFS